MIEKMDRGFLRSNSMYLSNRIDFITTSKSIHLVRNRVTVFVKELRITSNREIETITLHDPAKFLCHMRLKP